MMLVNTCLVPVVCVAAGCESVNQGHAAAVEGEQGLISAQEAVHRDGMQGRLATGKRRTGPGPERLGCGGEGSTLSYCCCVVQLCARKTCVVSARVLLVIK